jgi:hypothetical protein
MTDIKAGTSHGAEIRPALPDWGEGTMTTVKLRHFLFFLGNFMTLQIFEILTLSGLFSFEIRLKSYYVAGQHR